MTKRRRGSGRDGGGTSQAEAERELTEFEIEEELNNYLEAKSDIVVIRINELVGERDDEGNFIIPKGKVSAKVREEMARYHKGISEISHLVTKDGRELKFENEHGKTKKKMCNENAIRPFVMVQLTVVDLNGKAFLMKILMKKANLYVIGLTSGGKWYHVKEENHKGVEVVNVIDPTGNGIKYVDISIGYKSPERQNSAGNICETAKFFATGKMKSVEGAKEAQMHFQRVCWWFAEPCRFTGVFMENVDCFKAPDWSVKVDKKYLDLVTLWDKCSRCLITNGVKCIKALKRKDVIGESESWTVLINIVGVVLPAGKEVDEA